MIILHISLNYIPYFILVLTVLQCKTAIRKDTFSCSNSTPTSNPTSPREPSWTPPTAYYNQTARTPKLFRIL